MFEWFEISQKSSDLSKWTHIPKANVFCVCQRLLQHIWTLKSHLDHYFKLNIVLRIFILNDKELIYLLYLDTSCHDNG